MTPQNTVAIVYDYDQTLSPSYMQEDVIFPAFGINGEKFWRRCTELVHEHGYDNELAYMKVMLDTFGMDRPTNAELKRLGSKLNFYKGLPEMFEEFRNNLLAEEQIAHGVTVEHNIISSGLKVLLDGSRLQPYVGEQVLEAVVAGPDGANRLFTITGAANVSISVSGGQRQTQTWTFLVGPAFSRGQFYRAIGEASVSSQIVNIQTAPGSFQVQINSVEADWDDESGRVEVRVEIFVTVGAGIAAGVSQIRYWVTILAQIAD